MICDSNQPPLMEVEQVLKLYDSFWFGLTDNPSSSNSPSSSANPDHHIEENSSEAKFSRIQSIHNRSMSDQLSSMTSFEHDSLSPESVLLPPKLQTILSGKVVTDPGVEKNPERKHFEVLPTKNITRRGRKKRESKSLSGLEFEELKGFMDLGFVFSEEDKDSSLASIIPGLQRLGRKDEEEGGFEESVISRPYLSEAWEVQERKKTENPLINWKIPALINEIDIKDSLRWWAHTVASTVR